MTPESVNPLRQEITLRIPDVETAQREYDAICAKCPATHDEAYLDPYLYRLRAAWIDRKYQAKTRLDMATAFACSGWRQDGVPVPVSVQVQAKRHQTRKSIADLVTCYQQKLSDMDHRTPRSGAWISARNKAYIYARLIRERCQEDQVETPVLAPVPALPPLENPGRGCPPLKASTGDPRLDERRRKDRLRMKQRYQETKVVNG